MKRYITSIVVAVLLVTNLITCTYLHKYKTSYNLVKTNVVLPDSLSVKPAYTYRDSDSVEHLVIASKDIRTVQENSLAKLDTTLKTVAKALDIKIKQIQDVQNISTQTDADHVKFLEKKIDSLQGLTYYYQDRNLKLAVRPPTISDTLGSFDFSYNADLNIYQYWKRNKILGLRIGTKASYTDISSNDPRTTVLGVRKLTVIQKEPAFGFRLQAVGGYSFSSGAVFLGPSARFDYKDLSIRGSYFYNDITKQWSPNVALEYNIIK